MLITGAAGDGKTCTKHVLFGLDPPKNTSTKLCEPMDKAFVHDVAFSDEDKDYKWNILKPDDKNLFHEMLASSASTKVKEKQSSSEEKKKTEKSQLQLPRSSPGSKSQAIPSKNPRSKFSFKSFSGLFRKKKHSENVQAGGGQTLQTEFTGGVSEHSDHEPIIESNSKQLLLSKLEVALKNRTRGAHTVHWIHFLDSGGQSEFHDCLPLFVRGTTVVMYVTDLTKDMSQQANDDIRQDGQSVGASQSTKHQRKEILERMIRSVIYEERHHDKKVRLMVIGTHIDDIRRNPQPDTWLNMRNESIKELLKPFVEENEQPVKVVYYKSYSEPVDFIYPVDGKQRSENTLEVAKQVRKDVVVHCSIEKPIPITWFLLEDDLRSSSKGILTFKTCKSVADKLEIPLESFTLALKYFHEINVFWYFPDSNEDQRRVKYSLSNWVFTDTLIPVKIISGIVKLARETHNCTDGIITNGRFKDDKRFFSMLESKECDAIRRCKEVNFREEHIIKLLENILVIACIKKGPPRTFLMPCLLDYRQHQSDFRVPNAKVAPRAIKLTDHECIPCGFFCALSCSLIQRWVDDKLRKGRPAGIVKTFRNYVEVETPTPAGVMCNIKVVDSFKFIEIHVQPTKTSHEIYKFEQDLNAAIEEVAKACCYDAKYIKDALHYLCDCEKPYHVARLQGLKPPTLACDRSTNPTYMEIHEKWQIGTIVVVTVKSF